MIIKIYGSNGILNTGESSSCLIEKNIESNAVLTDLDITGSFSAYYEIGSILENKSQSLPYIINAQNQVQWDIRYREVLVTDFLKTHEILNKSIQIQLENSKSLVCLNINDKMLYMNISTLLNFTIIIHTILKDLSKNCGTHPLNVLDFILRKNEWHIEELADYLHYDSGRLIRLLSAMGYTIDASGRYLKINIEMLKELKEKLKTSDLSTGINEI